MEHVCKLCKKGFLSGRVWGGHMRCHGAKKSAKTEKNIKMCRAHSEVENDDYAGYGLRVNPKKSWKISGHSKFVVIPTFKREAPKLSIEIHKSSEGATRKKFKRSCHLVKIGNNTFSVPQGE
ncbi:hypothetical protein ACFX12_024809 [Malus domestica]